MRAGADGASPIDVAIVGAGIVGIAVAHVLAEEGRRVVVIDRLGPAEATSAGNAGAFAFSDILPLASPGIMRKAPRWLLDPLGPLSLRPAYALRIAPWLWRFWRASRRPAFEAATRAQVQLMRLARSEMGRLVDAAGLGAMVRSDGCLEVYESDEELAESRPGWEARAREGIDFRHLAFEEIADLQPGLSPRFRCATFVPGWQTVSDPRDFALALFAGVERRGGISRRGDVAAIEPLSGGGATIRFSDGDALTVRKVVAAAGAWSKPLAAGLGDVVPLETERGYNTTLPPGAFDLKRQIVFGGHGFVATPLSGGVRIGGAVELGGLSLAPNFKRSEAMLAKAKTFMPDLATEGGRQWMGFRPSMPDSLPVIGPSKASPDVIYAFGHGHLGLTQSAATARLVADLIAGRGSSISLDPFRPSRFS